MTIITFSFLFFSFYKDSSQDQPNREHVGQRTCEAYKCLGMGSNSRNENIRGNQLLNDSHRVRLDTAENWKLKTEKHCSKIIFKCVNSTVRPIFNEKVLKSEICRSVNSTQCALIGWKKLEKSNFTATVHWTVHEQ